MWRSGGLAQALAAQLAQDGDSPALVEGERIIYRSELLENVATARDRLLRHGLKSVPVALYFSPDVDAVVFFLASLEAGVPVLLLDAASGSVHQQHQPPKPQQNEAPNDLQQPYPDEDAQNPLIAQFGLGGIYRGGRLTLYAEAQSARPDLALMLTTSGTTGAAKCVMLSHDNLLANARAICRYLPMQPGDVGISTLPLSYSFGLSLLTTHLLCGGTMVLTKEPVMSRAFWQLLQHHQVSSISGVPFVFQMLKTLKFDAMSLPSLRYLTQAGGRMPLELSAWCGALCDTRGWQLYQMYGQTEASARIAYLPPSLLAEFADCIGIAIPDGELLLRDVQSREPILGDNIEGELCFRGPNVMLGYAETSSDLNGSNKLDELATGDLAERLPNGLYRITGRLSRFIKMRGKRLSLDELEKALMAQGLGMLMATGVDDKLLLVIENPADEDTAKAVAKTYLTQTLGLHPSLYAIEIRESLPRLASGKPDYRILKSGMFDTNVPETSADALRPDNSRESHV